MSGRRPWRARLQAIAFTAFALLAVLGAVAAAFYVVDLSGERVFLDRERRNTLSDQSILLDVYARDGISRLSVVIARRAREAAAGELYGVFDPAGRRISGNLLTVPPNLRAGVWGQTTGRTSTGPLDMHASLTPLRDGYVLVVGRDLAGKHQFESDVLDSFVVAIAIVVVASLGVGLALNWLAAKRVQVVANIASRIAAGDLTARAPVSGRGSDFDQICRSLNAMLDRIELLMTEMRTVTDSLAHDLRTPLTRMRTVVEAALQPESNDENRRDALEYAQAELDQVLSIFTALLDIARAEAGLSRELMQPVRLDALAEELAELFCPVLEDAGQELVIGDVEPLVITAHAPLLRQAVGNLLFNAARHAGEGAQVTLAARQAGGFAEIAVADTGRGVPQDQLGRLGQRFVRLDSARGGSGSGLGLAIASAAAKLHGGELLLQDNGPGLRAVLRLRRD